MASRMSCEIRGKVATTTLHLQYTYGIDAEKDDQVSVICRGEGGAETSVVIDKADLLAFARAANTKG